MPASQSPTVTIAIPAFNEADFIAGVLDIFLNQSYPHISEILVCDGGSTDATRDIVSKIAEENKSVILLDNRQKHQTFALNIMLEQAKGEIFLRADAHSEYALDYVEKCVETLLKSDALNAGGAQRYLAKSTFQAALAMANKSNFGSGSAAYKKVDFSGFVDTVYLGCFHTEVLRMLGGFSEKNIQNQDTELNIRLKKQKDNAVYLSSDIKVYYYPRTNWLALWRQYYRYGKGRRITHDLHRKENALRGRLPFIFAILLLLILAWNKVYFLGVVSGIVLLIMIDTIRNIVTDYDEFLLRQWKGDSEKMPDKFTLFVLTVTSVCTMAFAHALGFMVQTVKNLFRKDLRG